LDARSSIKDSPCNRQDSLPIFVLISKRFLQRMMLSNHYVPAVLKPLGVQPPDERLLTKAHP